jgi:hypothetical protein
MKLDQYLASDFVYKARMLGGRGDYGNWEGGDLERLSLIDDEESNPRKFFLMSVLCTRVRLLLLEARVVFFQAEIFNFNHMFQKIYQKRFLQYVRNNFLVNLYHDQAKSFNLSSLQP